MGKLHKKKKKRYVGEKFFWFCFTFRDDNIIKRSCAVTRAPEYDSKSNHDGIRVASKHWHRDCDHIPTIVVVTQQRWPIRSYPSGREREIRIRIRCAR